MKIIFMGTSSFACPAFLKILADPNHQIVATYTKEPQIAGRGQKLRLSPIHELAQHHNLSVLTPKTLREASIIEQFRSFNADIAIVISYGLLLPKQILEIPKFGCFNLHPSKLPLWRGAAPIQRTIMAGDETTAVCIIKMDEGLDSGDIACEENIKLSGNETYGELAKSTAEIGAKLISKTIQDLESGQILLKEQNHSLATYAKKIEKSECEIDWSSSGIDILRKVRGLNGSLGASFFYDQEKIKILAAEFLNKAEARSLEVGLVIDENFGISCKDGIIFPKIMQREGKKELPIREFLNGFKPQVGKELKRSLGQPR